MTAIRCAIYVRISQDRDGAGLGVQRQEEDCRKLAAQLGWTVVAVYPDNDTSAYSGKRRPQYEQLLEALESRSVYGVLAWHPDRLHRSPKELERYIDLSESHGITTHTVQAGRWDLSTPSGRAVARTLGAWARYESEHKGERIKRARHQQALAGGWKGGIRPYGFEKDGVTVREAEADEIRKAAEAVVSGVSLRSLVRDLNERGIPTATGRGAWTSIALRDTIMRPRTAGLSSYHGEVVGKAVWEPVVPRDTWEAACTILTDPARSTNQGRSGTIRWLGSGIYLCGVCGKAELRVSAKVDNKGRSRRTYRCRNREMYSTTGHVTREADVLDLYVEELMVGRLSDRKLLRQLTERTDASADVAGLVNDQAVIRQRLDELAGLFADGTITGRQLAAGTAKLTTRADELAKLLAVEGTRGPFDEVAAAGDVRTLWFGTKADRSDGLSLGKRRAILQALATVTVLKTGQRGPVFDPNGVQVDWH